MIFSRSQRFRKFLHVSRIRLPRGVKTENPGETLSFLSVLAHTEIASSKKRRIKRQLPTAFQKVVTVAFLDVSVFC